MVWKFRVDEGDARVDDIEKTDKSMHPRIADQADQGVNVVQQWPRSEAHLLVQPFPSVLVTYRRLWGYVAPAPG